MPRPAGAAIRPPADDVSWDDERTSTTANLGGDTFYTDSSAPEATASHFSPASGS